MTKKAANCRLYVRFKPRFFAFCGLNYAAFFALCVYYLPFAGW